MVIEEADKTVALCALVACAFTSTDGLARIAVHRIQARTPEYLLRTASGDRAQPMGDRKLRKVLAALVDDGLAVRQRGWESGHTFGPTPEGRAKVAHRMNVT